MAAVTEWRVFRRLAEAEIERFFLWNLELEGLQARSFVGAIAKRLIRAAPARTPPMGSGFDFKRHGFETAGNWFFCHGRRIAEKRLKSIILGSRIAG